MNTTTLTTAQLSRLDCGFLREHFAAYLLDTYGADDDTPLGGDDLALIKMADTDPYIRKVAKLSVKKMGFGTSFGYIKQGASDALDLAYNQDI